jgi:hypothetical protein
LWTKFFTRRGVANIMSKFNLQRETMVLLQVLSQQVLSKWPSKTWYKQETSK